MRIYPLRFPGCLPERLRPRLRCGLALASLSRLRQLRAGEGAVGEALAKDSGQSELEPLGIGGLPLVEAERLFSEVAEQMERLHADVGATEGPEIVFQRLRTAIGTESWNTRLRDKLRAIYRPVWVKETPR